MTQTPPTNPNRRQVLGGGLVSVGLLAAPGIAFAAKSDAPKLAKAVAAGHDAAEIGRASCRERV